MMKFLSIAAILILALPIEVNASKNVQTGDALDLPEQRSKRKRETVPQDEEGDPMEEEGLDPHAPSDFTTLEDDVLDASLFALLNEKRRRVEEETAAEPDLTQKIIGYQNVGLYHQLTAKLISAIQGETEETAPDMVLQAFYESESYKKAADLCDQLPDGHEDDKEEMLGNALVPLGSAFILCMQHDQEFLLAGVLAQQADIEGTDPEDLADTYRAFVGLLRDNEEIESSPPVPGDPDYLGPSDCGFNQDWVYKEPPEDGGE